MLQKDPKPKLIPVPVWRCKSSECKAWVREEMTTEKNPNCPICNGAMMKSMKHLPELITKIKRQKKQDNDSTSIIH